MRLLVVEDYAPLLRSVSQGLREEGYAVDAAADGEEALSCLAAGPYDLVVLDIMLPKVDGLEVLRRMRADKANQKDKAAVLLLTAKDQIPDRVAGLDAGADDYLVKPFAFEELVARVRALLRRRYDVKGSVISIGDLEIDTIGRRVKRAGTPIVLSAREYALLEYLALRREQVVTRAEIWQHVYDFASDPSSNVVDVYIGYLRRKLDDPFDRKLIQTRRGQGYLLGEAQA
jgi:DNA-binding response OmpR family regulator